MRVAIVAESFLPQVNGVTNSVLRVLEHLERHGHHAMVLAPSARGNIPGRVHGAPVIPFGSVGLPGYRQVRVAVGGRRRLSDVLSTFAPDVVHLAAPFALGWRAVLVAERLRLPTVAVYQTELAGYAGRYGAAGVEPLVVRRLKNIHHRATMTLVPSSTTHERLAGWGVARLRAWGRGVDTAAFHPRLRDETWRAEVGGGRSRLVGYVGRLAPEKQVEHLATLAGLPDTRLVIVGDGPERARLEARLPDARFTGQLSGGTLARAVASLDVFVHPGELDTFGQTLQEAQASGVPVVAAGAGGPLDIVTDGVDGHLYRPGDLTGLRGGVTALLADDEARRTLGAAGRRRTETRTWDQVCAELTGHYREAIRLGPGSSLSGTPADPPGASSPGPGEIPGEAPMPRLRLAS